MQSVVRYGLYEDRGGQRLWAARPGIDWHGDPFSPHVFSWRTFAAASYYRQCHFPANANVWVDSIGAFPAIGTEEWTEWRFPKEDA